MAKNSATQILRDEHEAILKMLDATDRAAARLEGKQRVPRDILDGLLEFFRLFADRCHHGKEEDLLFPLLEKKGLPREGGPIGVMLGEHEEGRALIRRMAESATLCAEGDPAAAKAWAGAARRYSGLLREHIFKENNVLFMMAEQILSEAEQQQLAAEFERVEDEKMGSGTHERLHTKMREILERTAAEN